LLLVLIVADVVAAFTARLLLLLLLLLSLQLAAEVAQHDPNRHTTTNKTILTPPRQTLPNIIVGQTKSRKP
jgi:hypothetical protein